jgi:hypothetical protein
LQVPYDAAVSGKYPIEFTIEAFNDTDQVSEKLEEKSIFLIPR